MGTGKSRNEETRNKTKAGLFSSCRLMLQGRGGGGGGVLVHQSKECPIRPEKCAYCGKDVPHQQMEVGACRPVSGAYACIP